MNEEDCIERCLKSLTWCDEIVVIDSGSTDKTLEICSKYTEKVFHNDWPGYSEQKKFALTKCTSDWVLNIDADEEVSEGLQDAIQKVLESKESKVKGYEINRVVYHLNYWWREGGWHPEYRLRLCHRKNTSWGGSNIHEHAIVDGKVERLTGELYHYSFNNIAEHVAIINKYSSLLSDEIIERKPNTKAVLKLFFNPIIRFIKFYFLKKGYKYGIAGLIVAVTESFYVFLKYAKVWESRRRE